MIDVEIIRIVVEILAFMAAGGYFLFKVCDGWLNCSMSLEVIPNRIRNSKNSKMDILGIVIKLTNGVGLVRIVDVVTAVRFGDQTILGRIEGAVRYDFNNNSLTHGKPHPLTPQTGLGTNQQMALSTYVHVPTDAVCIIDVSILIKSRLTSMGEARSAVVSLPLEGSGSTVDLVKRSEHDT